MDLISLSVHIGRRVQAARGLMGLSPQALAQTMGFADGQTVAALERGQHALTADELVRLADGLAQPIDFFIDPFAVAGEATFAWQVAEALPDASRRALEHRVGGWLGLARWLHTHEAGPAPGADPASRGPALAVWCVDLRTTAGAVQGGLGRVGDLMVILLPLHGSVRERHQALAHAVSQARAWTAEKNPGNPIPPMEGPEVNDALFGVPAAGHLGADSAASRRATRPFSTRFVGRLHDALVTGAISMRKAARVMGMDLDALQALFAAHGLSKPADL
jgi:transcriptional regulator with XRE-family HTH domain